jgi:hypothetical protein
MSKIKDSLESLNIAVSSLAERITKILRNQGIADEHVYALVIEDTKLNGKIDAAVFESAEQLKRTYIVPVNFNASIEELLELGHYDSFEGEITSENFPTKRTGKVETKIELIPFRVAHGKEALMELDKMGYRPAEAHEVLPFGAKYPDLQRLIKIVALGSVWDDSKVVCLRGYSTWREVVIVRLADTRLWHWHCAAVRK